MFRIKPKKARIEKFTDPLNLLTLDNPDDDYYKSLQNAKYLCYAVSGGDYDLFARLWGEATMDEVWEYYRIKLADSYGKDAVNN